MDWKFIFLSFQGRLNRKPYWLGTIALLSLVVIGVFGVMFLTGGGGGVAAIGVIYLLLLWPTLAMGVKRLHDRNKSAWWLVVFYVVPTLLNVLVEGGDGEGVGAMIFGLASLAISIWALVELGFLRGTVGANRYGPDPLASPAG
ncbi:MAG: DUF805 domain-containing protein [Rhodospirillales bacterium]|jgi:uncharacterized membrane protein YhaH (DUF805 family)|nr:DUF805 domain-containing protein [Rhodospirillales bacterium]MDG4602656.1 DUF805 domain-containing protein [Defluviicoccus sp.]MDG4608113.1 DUF805 domain-containing protein [Defluviicoccus sp.]HOT84095.1 DUF805 domain-containing protein [Candidatus Defluviicoccus seviourii]HRW61300.1 DUF805 domain-containing protein [Defluviicoccus sp.]